MEAGSYIKKELHRNKSKVNFIKDISILEVDEIFTYIKKGQTIEGILSFYGSLLIGNQIKLLI